MQYASKLGDQRSLVRRGTERQGRGRGNATGKAAGNDIEQRQAKGNAGLSSSTAINLGFRIRLLRQVFPSGPGSKSDDTA
ncbi:hypothetical protein BM1_04170 [Bipolaris maydis]|nr:hypothetical protein BM1_04170 [Bipolaris maydis]